jgi:hypothetical protein
LRRRLTAGDIVGMLSRQPAHELVTRRRVAIGLKELVEVLTRELKKDVVDKRNWRRRALDVEEDTADAPGAETDGHTPGGVGAGKYTGPKQTG